MKKLRYISVTRFFAAAAVVFLHAAVKTMVSFEAVPLTQWEVANFISASTRWAVPIFMMIAGALALDPTKKETAQHILRKRWQRVGIPLLAWVVFYAVYYHFTRHDALSLTFVLRRIIFDQPYEHLYFLFVLLELSFLTPFLRSIVRTLSLREGWVITLFLTLLAIVAAPTRFILPFFIPYLSYFVGGYYLSQLKIPQKYTWVLWTSVALIIVFISSATQVLFSDRTLSSDPLLFYNYFHPLIILLSTGVFLGLKTSIEAQPQKTAVLSLIDHYLAPTAFGIYLIHPVWLDFSHWLLPASFFSPQLSFLETPSIGVLTLTLSFLSIFLLQRLPLLKQVVT